MLAPIAVVGVCLVALLSLGSHAEPLPAPERETSDWIPPAPQDVEFSPDAIDARHDGSPPPVVYDEPVLKTPRLRFYEADGCAPCEAFKATALVDLEEAGWVVGETIEIVYAGDEVVAPRFEIITSAGVVAAMTGFTSKDLFHRWVKRSLGHPLTASGDITSGVCQCVNCQCGTMAGRRIRPPSDRVPSPDFVFTGMVEPSAVFTEYPEEQGIIDPNYQSVSYSPQVGYQNCANGQCAPQAMSHGTYQTHAYGGPVRRVMGLFGGGCVGGMCR